MKVLAEKMRQFSARLKCGGETLRQNLVELRDNTAESLQRAWQRSSDWRGKASQTDPQAAQSDISWADSDGQRADDRMAEIFGPSPAPARSEPSDWRQRYPVLDTALRIGGIALAAFLILPYVFILLFRFIDPPVSLPMLGEALTGTSIRQQWVDFDDISPNLPKAVVLSEDAHFCRHWGVDWGAVGEVLQDLEDGEAARGASTLPMQVAKNLFLWPVPTLLRKPLEVPQAYFMSLIWPKQRVAEIYLNIAEWAPGVFGAEAAARYHFGKTAGQLNERESALLAASLPNPIQRRAGRPGPATLRLARHIQARMGREAHDAACIFN